MVQAAVHSLESFGASDGPGIRFIVFLNGCSMRCKYCHNPDTWARGDFEYYSADQLLAKALRYESYWGKDGGITVSGGEPLLQIDFLIEFFRLCKEAGVSTCIDTSAQPFTREQPWFGKFEELMRYTDLLLLDIKHIDSAKHEALTGRPNENILDCARYLSETGKPVWIRHVLVPTINDDDESLGKLDEFLKSLNNVKRVDVLPYHTLGIFKWKELNIPYELEDVPTPTKEQTEHARQMLHAAEYRG